MHDYTTENIDWFFGSIAPFQAAYQEPELAFLIYDTGDKFQFVSGKLLFSPLSSDIQDREIRCGGFFGFRGKLSSVGLEPRRMLGMLLEGKIPSVDQTYLLAPPEHPPSLSKVATPYNIPPDQSLVFKLSAYGLGRPLHVDEAILGEMRAADIPYANLNDLLLDLGLPSHGYGFEVEATQPIAIGTNSIIDGEEAKFEVIASKNLTLEAISLGAIVHGHNGIFKRLQIKGTEFTWSVSNDNPDVLLGKFTLDVPKASVVQCFANYEKTCFQSRWIGDPKLGKNHLRNIYEIFDPELKKAVQLLTQGGRQGNSDGQESAVCWLLWFLGFAPLHTGNLNEAPDIVAVSHDESVRSSV